MVVTRAVSLVTLRKVKEMFLFNASPGKRANIELVSICELSRHKEMMVATLSMAVVK